MDKTLAETGDAAIWRCGKVICEEEIWIEREPEKVRVKHAVRMGNRQAELQHCWIVYNASQFGLH
jgi:hypothetical protein